MSSSGKTSRRWPDMIGPAAFGWAIIYFGFGVACVLAGAAVFGPAAMDWFVVATGGLGMAATWPVRRWNRRRAVRVSLWIVGTLAAVSAFGLLMDLVVLMSGQAISKPAAAANHALGMLGVAVLAAAALARPEEPCHRCGQSHGPRRPAEPVSAPRRVRLAAYVGALAFLPYLAMKTYWAFGGTFAGIDKAHMLAASRRNGASELILTLESWGIDFTVLLGALGVFLLLGLVRPWGQVFPRWTLLLAGRPVPRWLPIIPAAIGAGTLAPYGVLGAGYLGLVSAGVLDMRTGDFETLSDALTVGWVGHGVFGVYGTALLIAVVSYWRRTRPGCD